MEGSVVQPLFSCRVTRAESSHSIRRVTDGVIAGIQGQARGAGDLRVALFPSKHSRVRIPSPALTAKNKLSGLRLEAGQLASHLPSRQGFASPNLSTQRFRFNWACIC